MSWATNNNTSSISQILSDQVEKIEQEERMRKEAERVQALLQADKQAEKLAINKAIAQQQSDAIATSQAADKPNHILQAMINRLQEKYTTTAWQSLVSLDNQNENKARLNVASNEIVNAINQKLDTQQKPAVIQTQELARESRIALDPNPIKDIKQVLPNPVRIQTALKTGQLQTNQVLQSYLANALKLQLPKKTKEQTQKANIDPVSKSDMLSLGAKESAVDTLTDVGKSIVTNAKKKKLKAILKESVVASMLSHIGSDAESDQITAKAIQASYTGLVGKLKESRQLGDDNTVDALYKEAIEEAKSDIAFALNTYKSDASKLAATQQLTGESSDAGIRPMQEKAMALGMTQQELNQSDTVIDLHDLGYMLWGEASHSGDSDASDSQKQTLYQYADSDTADVVLDRIRTNLMQLAIGGFFQSLTARFKLFKDKQKAIKLGVYTDTVADSLSADANQLAVDRLQRMLDEALFEQASFHTLSGPDYDENTKKIKAIINNLNRLGVSVSDQGITRRQAKANAAMLPVIELEQLHITAALLALDSDHNPAVKQSLERRLTNLEHCHVRLSPAHETKEIELSTDYITRTQRVLTTG